MNDVIVIFQNNQGSILSMSFEDIADWIEWRDEYWHWWEDWQVKLLKVW